MIKSFIKCINTIFCVNPILNRGLYSRCNIGSRYITTSNIDNDNSKITSSLDNDNSIDKKERVQKYLARCGVASRRLSEEMIKSGRVTINDKVAKIGESFLIGAGDIVKVDNKIIRPSIPKLWIHHKPRNTLVSTKDSFGRDCLVEILQKVMNKPHIIPVGRLDYYSEGLILLTNDGELSRYLEHPKTEVTRIYKVRIFGQLTERMKLLLEKGIVIDDVQYKPIKAEIESETESNSWIILTLTEGKNREIRKILEYFNIKVLRLVRVKYGPYLLPSTLKPGEVIEAKLTGDLQKFVKKWSKDLRATEKLIKDKDFSLNQNKILNK
ncbi:hypothetical protein CYY_005865 [Polysphondylium violaceum]|uniref:RNA-binding S4 domain-containing protein n=1 Tax=Polysphondylium violaceum TaxID=133409 RepID=A0A8J4PSS2_9MYCE|nr:hypothetical protein CYY_005865 [Polysphondylium violaceum]